MNQFNPDWSVAPGATISDIMEERSIPHHDLASQLGLGSLELIYLLNGDLEIDDNLAQKLSEVLGSSKEFWLKLESQYREKK